MPWDARRSNSRGTQKDNAPLLMPREQLFRTSVARQRGFNRWERPCTVPRTDIQLAAEDVPGLPLRQLRPG